MRRFVSMILLSLIFLLAPLGNVANAMQGGGCGKCGGSGVTCQTNQRVAFAALTTVLCFYQMYVVAPLAEGKAGASKWLVYALSYGIPAAGAVGGYVWWASETPAKETPKSKEKHNDL